MQIPAELEWWREEPGGAAWLERLPRLVEECVERWALVLGSPFESASVSYVAPATLPDGTEAVLKVNFPDPESEHEADALRLWAGEGAARLLAEDAERRALLVGRCLPGEQLWTVGDEERANSIAAGVLRRVSRPPAQPHPFRPLAEEAVRWAEELPARWRAQGRPFEQWLLDAAVAALGELGPSQTDCVVVNQDFHGGNVLRATGDLWLAIDPKPLVGERAFDTVSLLRDRREELVGDARPELRMARRLDQLSQELELDRGLGDRPRAGVGHLRHRGRRGDDRVRTLARDRSLMGHDGHVPLLLLTSSR